MVYKVLLVSIEKKQSNGDQSQQKSKRKTRDENNDSESPLKAKKQSKFIVSRA